ncbi:MAG: hypothetical protein LBH85_05950 [Treponema sp.]|jgi:hypothetical protein|nr:hypothetical protein [Treponema sp.]
MAKLAEATEWVEDIYRLEIADDAIGGEDGVANLQAKQLGSRTRYLKQAVEAPVPAERLTGTLTDAAASTTLPPTASETIWAKVQTARNNLKSLFASLTSHTGNTSNPHAVTKAQVGLGSVDNTSDANKPVSTAQQNALNAKATKDSAGNVTDISGIEFTGVGSGYVHGGYMDFHHGGSSVNFTSRIIEEKSGELLVQANFRIAGNLQVGASTGVIGIGDDAEFVDIGQVSTLGIRSKTDPAGTSYFSVMRGGTYQHVIAQHDTPTFTAVTLQGELLPRTNPVQGSFSIGQEDSFTPPRGWYSFGRGNSNDYFGADGSGPYSGYMRMGHWSGDFTYNGNTTVYYRKF